MSNNAPHSFRSRLRRSVAALRLSRPSPQPERPRRRWMLRAALLLSLTAVAGAGWAVARHRAGPAAPTVPYSEVAAAVGAGAVAELAVSEGGTRLTATLKRPRAIAGRETAVVATRMPHGALGLADLERWAAAGASVRVDSGAPSDSHMASLIASVLVAGIVLVAFLYTRNGGVRAGRFTVTPTARHLTLADVGGAREAQAELRDVIAFLADPERFRVLGAKCPTGVLLVGPPGTGKTLLARAVAGEAGVPVLVASGAEFSEMFVGVGARRVRELARQARAFGRCIVFIDEFDSLGGRRGRPNRTSEEDVTLNQLLVEMDGMTGGEGVVWMAATNREDILDPAVRRPGRFDRVVEVGLPTAVDRLEILRIHAGQRPMAPDVDLERIATLTVGYSGAELANLLNEAAIVAVQEGSPMLTNAHIEQARDKILLGRVRTGVTVSDEERRLIALHEAGHALVGLVACPADRLHKVTIEPRGRSLGAAHFAPDTDRFLHSRRYLEGVIAKALGGRAAELVFLGPEAVTSGAGSDLVQATGIARRMVAEFGMSDELGLVSLDPTAHGGAPSAQLQAEVDRAVRTLIRTQAERAEAIVREHRDAVEAIAEALVDRTVLDAAEVHEIAEQHAVPLSADVAALRIVA